MRNGKKQNENNQLKKPGGVESSDVIVMFFNCDKQKYLG